MTRETDPTFHAPSLALAVLAAGGACAVALVAVGVIYSGSFPGILGVLVMAAYFAGGVVIAAVLGLPMLLILRSLGLVNLWTTLLLGAVLGTFVGWISAQDNPAFDIGGWLIAGTLAALAGRSAWTWAQRRYATNQLGREGSGNFMEK